MNRMSGDFVVKLAHHNGLIFKNMEDMIAHSDFQD